MTRLKEIAARRRSALVGLFMASLAVVFVLAWPADSGALGCGWGWMYYNDAAKTEVIGARFWYPEGSCGCEYVNWGRISQYTTYKSFSCP